MQLAGRASQIGQFRSFVRAIKHTPKRPLYSRKLPKRRKKGLSVIQLFRKPPLAQVILVGAGFETRRKCTRRDEFLDTMNTLVPWAELSAVVELYYPKRGNGRPPIGQERMSGK